MRIGVVCPYSFDEPGGVQAHIIDVARRFIDSGHHVRVIGPCSDDADVPDFIVRGGRSVPFRYNGSVARLSFGPWVDRRIRRFIREGNFDVLHIHEPNSPSFSMAALRLAEGPIVATYHASSSGSRLLRLALPVLRPMLEKIRGGIAVSEMARRWQVEQLGGDPILIPNGVDTAFFGAARAEHDTGDADEPTPPELGRRPEIVFLGRIDEPRKGLDILLRALAQLDRDVHCTVIGGGTPRSMDSVSFVGRVSDAEKARILGAADIYVAPNTGGESFGIVLVEAMAAGAAVVASDLEAFAAVCDAESEQPAGLLFRVGSDRDLAGKLRLLLDDEDRRRALVEAGRRRAQLYDCQAVADKVLEVYRTVDDGSGVRLC
ncbi:glycosyltransferase family 4 protein [Corynebacterium pygosceleis]|uniref:Glycosyltransferase family 4 protein n=1 Tax=Corynebacterium pygosceleis TaxID=2800406 RepID=A0A9Q4C6N7_9CORY|nr:glycosyltransferase family 4 protein [Corynebacterium pygosceleis]MCK7636919.1 glycosyltransferase family 4 protein [Corynebacterium pygosceleis]MCK7674393.1 glycosyltransferase family 4 protein [Corynebacterium pygosceleis]MCL0120309.1 glycosyltransferase family 4 protein [Corynebacterium pygosceleis]MCX7467672.1 glycosyltransferase family 4 protein [Corynebacterium pygosceleis]